MKKIERDLKLLTDIRRNKDKLVRNKYPFLLKMEKRCLQRIRENHPGRDYLKTIS